MIEKIKNDLQRSKDALITCEFTFEQASFLLGYIEGLEIQRPNAKRRWIPVEQRPAEKQRVIILLKSGDVSNTVFENGEFMWDEGIPYRPGAVRGWLPMPTEVE